MSNLSEEEFTKGMPRLLAKKKKQKTLTKHKSLWRKLNLGLVGLQVITSVMFLVSLISMNIIGGKEIFLVAASLIFLATLSGIKLLANEPTKKVRIACTTISVICIVGTVFAFRYTAAFNNFLNKITNRNLEMKEYSVMVLNDSGFMEIQDLAGKSVGFLNIDPKVNNAEQALQNTVAINANFYDDADTLTKVLNNRITDAIVLETGRIEVMKEDENKAAENMRIIYTFEIELESRNVEATKEVTKDPFIVFISGSDSRKGIKATANSDVNIVAVVNPVKGKILLVTIPRDTYIQLHGTDGVKNFLFHAGLHGIEMSRTTVEDFLDIGIDYTIKVGFDAVVKVVNQLGGVDIYSDIELDLSAWSKTEPSKRCSYIVGTQHVDGECALRFARERKSYSTGDFHRGKNQQQVITGIINKLSNSKDYVLKLPTILNVAADSFETSFSRDEITAFIRMQLSDQINWQVESISIEGEEMDEAVLDIPRYAVIANEDSIRAAQDKIAQYLVNE